MHLVGSLRKVSTCFCMDLRARVLYYPVQNLNLPTYLLNYLLTPWSRAPLEKLTGSAASQEIPRIFGTQTFITVLTSARHLDRKSVV